MTQVGEVRQLLGVARDCLEDVLRAMGELEAAGEGKESAGAAPPLVIDRVAPRLETLPDGPGDKVLAILRELPSLGDRILTLSCCLASLSEEVEGSTKRETP